jgi:hypothetical protein
MFFGPLMSYADKMHNINHKRIGFVLNVLVWRIAHNKHIYLLYFLSYNLKLRITIK